MKLTKFIIAPIIGIIILTSCDAPRDRRLAYNPKDSDSSMYDNNDNNSDKNNSPITTSNIPSDANCSFSTDGISGYASYYDKIGNYTLCKSSDDPRKLYLQVKIPINDVKLCIIPTVSDNLSTYNYMGRPTCVDISDPKKIIALTIYPREGFESKNIERALIMKNEAIVLPWPYLTTEKTLLPDAYLFCIDWLTRYQDTRYCDTFANFASYHKHTF